MPGVCIARFLFVSPVSALALMQNQFDGRVGMTTIQTRILVGVLLFGALAVLDARAQSTSGPAASQEAADAPKETGAPKGAESSKAGDSSLPALDLLGLGEEEAKQIIQAYREARANPNDAQKVGEVGILCQRQTKFSAAVQFLKRAAELAPGDVKWQYFMGLALEESFEYPSALEAFRRAQKIDGAYPPILTHIADLIREKETDEAIALYRRALELSPKDPRIHFGLGECARLQKKPDEAIKHYQNSLQFAPKYARAHGALAKLMEAKGDRINAGIHADAEKRGREPPVVRDPLYIRMMCIGAAPDWLQAIAAQLVDSGEFDLAIAVIEDLNKHPGFQDEANKLLGRLHYFRQDLDLSVKHFSEYLVQFSGDDENRRLFAQALMVLKRYDEAAKQYEAILSNKPDDLDMLVQAGTVALIKNVPTAPSYFQQALIRNQKHPGACVGMIAALLLTGDVSGAGKAYPSALRAYPSPETYDFELIGKLLLVLGARRQDPLMPIEPEVFVRFADSLAKDNYTQSAERYRDPLGAVAGAAERAAAKGDFAQAFQLIQHCIDCDEGGVIRGAVSRVVQEVHRKSADSCARFFRDNDPIAQNDTMLANMLAWIRATSAEAAIRNGKEAVRLALLADKATGHKNPEVLDSLAAAYAETGDFPRAVQTLKDALQLKATTASNGRTARLRERLELYEKKSPFRH